MYKFLAAVRSNWLLLFIALQPVLDIVSYFMTVNWGRSYIFAVRIFLLVFVLAISFVQSKNKKKLIFLLSPFMTYFVIHVLNLVRISEFNLVQDIKYFVNVFQVPVLAIVLIDYVREKNYEVNKIKKILSYNFIFLVFSIFLAYITNTYQNTYLQGSGYGIIGWFSSANTSSMILAALAPWFLYRTSILKKWYTYLAATIIVVLTLFYNGTRSCYLALVASLAVMSFLLIISNNESHKIVKVLISAVALFSAIFLYVYSPTFARNNDTLSLVAKNEEEISSIMHNNINKPDDCGDGTDDDGHLVNPNLDFDFEHININDNKLIYDILSSSYIYTEIMDIHGPEAVIKEMKPYLSASALSDNRLRKAINAKIEFKQADSLTHSLGIGYSVIQKHSLDLENDLQAIFYYYGYIGFALYLLPYLYLFLQAAILFFRKLKLIQDREFVILPFILLLLFVGGEFSGAILRKANANIYIAMYFVLMYIKLENVKHSMSNDCKINPKKITFLLLHLGYGGIETATINTANALSDKYEVELVSFYHLKEEQTQYINENVTVKYLYDGEPNRNEFTEAVKHRRIFGVFREGFKAINILAKKKYLVKREILESNAFALVSTRYDFSVLLSKYGKDNVIKIAQEHHHHNNNNKYINIIKTKYDHIDYLFALTESLQRDYRSFLKQNKHTRVVVVPNMLDKIPDESSDLKNKNIISICRLHEGKKLDELVEIFSKIENKSSKLYLIGDGDEGQKIKQKIDQMNLGNRVVMLGYMSKEDQKKYILDSALYAMTSISEGLPMVLIEAMGYGMPCIAYKTDSGVTDIIEDGKNGFIVDNRNQNVYINTINNLLNDDNLLHQLGRNAKESAYRFERTNVTKKWYSVLEG